MSAKTDAAGQLITDMAAEGYPAETEFIFHPSRKWRFDLAYPQVKLAIEVDGRGRHQQEKGEREDQQKINAATEMGWRVLRYPAGSVKTHKRRARIVEQITRILLGVDEPEEAAIVLSGD